ncbi:MAG TPA: hypothetical protein VFU15_16540, partial [Bacteroidia bacterium]|nr:hypothetical protein [Bacteroidia bacterium]
MGRQYSYERIDRRMEDMDDWYLDEKRKMAGGKKTVQAKLEISQPGDKHEQEADAVARNVVNGGKTNMPSITPVSDSISTARKDKPEYTPFEVQFTAYSIVNGDPDVKKVILAIQKIDEDTLWRFMKPDSEFLPQLIFSDKISGGGSTPEKFGKRSHKKIYIASSLPFPVAVARYLHELNHYIDIWLAGKSAQIKGRNLAQARDERGEGIASPDLVSTDEQKNAVGELVTSVNKDLIGEIENKPKPEDTYDPEDSGREKTLKKNYRRWAKKHKNETWDEFLEQQKKWLDQEAISSYGRWGAKADPLTHVVTSSKVELGYVFEKSLYYKKNPDAAPGEWMDKFDGWFEGAYASQLSIPSLTKASNVLQKKESNGTAGGGETASPQFTSDLESTKG